MIADVADRVVVMYAGRVVEQASLRQLFYDPLHPYTWGLLGSVPRVDRDRPDRLPTIPGSPPSLLHPPAGCHFRPRCPHRFDRCVDVPPLIKHDPAQPDHLDRCLLLLGDKRRLRIVDDAIGLPVLEAPKSEVADPSDEVAGAGVASSEDPTAGKKTTP